MSDRARVARWAMWVTVRLKYQFCIMGGAFRLPHTACQCSAFINTELFWVWHPASEFACIATAPAYFGEFPAPRFARFRPQHHSSTASKSTYIQPLRLSLTPQRPAVTRQARQKGTLRWPRTFTLRAV